MMPLREFSRAQGFSIAGEFVDRASATDLRGRRAWRATLDAAAKRKIGWHGSSIVWDTRDGSADHAI